jgi:hypothetical protein
MLNYWRRESTHVNKFDNHKTIFCGTKEVEMNKDDCIIHKLTCKKISAWTHMCKISLEE